MAFTTNDNAPYLYRKSGGGGDLEIDKLVGGTIAWNQYLRNANFASTSGWTVSSGSTFTVSNNVATFRADARYRSLTQSTPAGERVPKLNHIYMGIVKAKSYTNTDTYFYVRSVASAVLQTASKTLSTTEKEHVNVLKVTQEAYYLQFMVQDNNASGFGDITVQNARFFDLTLMFGSTIADYVYSLEQSSQGSGLAWLRNYGFFTEDYYDYNSGELKSVSNLVSHDMTGKNYFENLGSSVTTNGITYTVNSDGSFTAKGTATARANLFLRTVSNPQRLPQGDYILSQGNVFGVGEAFLELAIRRANGTTQYVNLNGRDNFAFTLNEGDYIYQPYFFVYSGTTIDATIYPMIRLASVTDDTYEPYTLHSYPLGDVTLRGLPKLNGNALYYDGDTYESNGTVTRKYGVVDLGSLNWGYRAADSSKPYPQEYATLSGAVSGISTNVVCPKYSASQEPVLGRTVDKTICTFNGAVYVSDSSYSTATEFKTAMSGVYLVYELASSTTETASTYTNPQWVDPNGTEKYTLSSNAFPMPVGHETTYNTDIGSKTVNTQVNLSMTEPQVRQVYAKEGDTARVLNIHLDQTEEDGTLRILRPDGTEVTADAVLVPDFYDGLMAEIPSGATEIVGKCYCDVEQNGVSSMPFTLNVKKNERQ